MRHGYKTIEELPNYETLMVEPVTNCEAPAALQGYTVMVIYKIVSEDHQGYYLAEEYSGLPHPILVIPEDQIIRR